jgi:hypothetical protein
VENFKTHLNSASKDLELFKELFKDDKFDKIKRQKNSSVIQKVLESVESRQDNILQFLCAKINSLNKRERDPNKANKPKKEPNPRGRRDRKRPEVPLEQLELIKKRILDISGKQRYEIFVNRLGLDPKTQQIDVKMFTKEQINIIEECLTVYEVERVAREARGELGNPNANVNNIEMMCLDDLQNRHNNIEHCAILSNIFDDSNISESLESSDESESKF